MKPVRRHKKLAAVIAAVLIALGIVAGTSSAAAADPANSGDVSVDGPSNSGDVSSDLTLMENSGDVS